VAGVALAVEVGGTVGLVATVLVGIGAVVIAGGDFAQEASKMRQKKMEVPIALVCLVNM